MVLLIHHYGSTTPHRETVVDSTSQVVPKARSGDVTVPVAHSGDVTFGGNHSSVHCTVIALVTVTPGAPFFFGTKDATTV